MILLMPDMEFYILSAFNTVEIFFVQLQMDT